MIFPFRDSDELSACILSLYDELSFSDGQLVQLRDLQLTDAQIGFICTADHKLKGISVFEFFEEYDVMNMCRWDTDSEAAGREMLAYLKKNYGSYQLEFTFSPENKLLISLLKECGAKLYGEQMNMELRSLPEIVNTDEIVLFSDAYMNQFHTVCQENDDIYWTADMLLRSPEEFRILLALKDQKVTGYLALTCCYEVNNIIDVFVRKEFRSLGYGSKLLYKAIAMNQPSGLTLQVDIDNGAAIALYEKMGFCKMEGKNTITAILKTD